MKRTIILLITCQCIIYFSCKKQEEPSHQEDGHEPYWWPTYIYDTAINAHLMQDYIFNVGTWWVYKDSLQGTLDTCIVENLADRNNGPSNSLFYLVRIVYNEKTGDFPTNYLLHNNSMFATLTDVIDSVNDSGEFYLNNKAVFLSTYAIDTFLFTDVYRLFYKNENYPSMPDSGYYYLKAGIGIIKSEYYYDGQRSVYEIMQYHIN